MIELQPDGGLFVRPFLSVTLGILALFLGKAVNRRVGVLREYNIPEPVSGGLLFAVAFWIVHLASSYRLSFDLGVRDVLLVYFFTTIGLNARVSDLKAGGRPLVVLTACVAAFLPIQNFAGMAASTALGQPAGLGILAGSVSLLGGHGTAIAWAPVFSAQLGIGNALEIGVLCATAGLVLSSVVGGPLAHLLVGRYRLGGGRRQAPTVGLPHDVADQQIDYFSFLRAILAIHICSFIGILVQQGLADWGFRLPLFVPCLLAGIVLTNVMAASPMAARWPDHTPALSLIAELALGVFLGMSLMSMQLWLLADLAGPIFVLLVLQLVLAVLFAVFVLFRILGRTYDAAVICSGFMGVSLGATPTAMANMTAVTQRHGASPVAFLVVPLVGAFFLDLLNAIAIKFLLTML